MTTHNPVTLTAQPGVPFVDIVREFDAPVADVFRAYTDPDLVSQWLGPRDLKMELHEYDARTGGAYSYTHRDAEGNGFGFRGVFHTVDPERSIVQTFEFDGYPGHISLDAANFEDLGGRTRVSSRSVYQSVEDRDGIVAMGMGDGLTEGYERLDELLASIPAR
ncbi:SRPBCC family protein [Glaciibacter sp. 2TAF33]|uniref:SRPBCC family protein n=1 Tax=Glaciibacter sp. 2TAF33 TaxID=3233015 RepID=UPI003F939ABE